MAVFSCLGVLLAVGGATADVYLHRGIETADELPTVRHDTGRDLATNIDLTLVAPEALPEVAGALRASGFRFARQSFRWSEIEPDRGRFAWDRYDAIVDALTTAGVQPVAVLHRSPTWARSEGGRNAIDAPPSNSDAFAAFVAAVVGRYADRLPYVQLWDAPNRTEQWGGVTPNPVDYAGLLARGSNAVRATRLDTKILLAELDPRDAEGRTSDADLTYLRGVLGANGGPFFDIVAARLDGGTRSPYDRSIDAERLNLSRGVLIRDLLLASGETTKPIWATRYGWSTSGSVSRDDQADFVVAGVERARAEWPWMGPLFAWSFFPTDVENGEAYALVDGEGVATPLLSAFATFAEEGNTDVAATGFLPVDAPQIRYEGDWEPQHFNERTYGTTSQVNARFTVRFAGTDLTAILRRSPNAGEVLASVNGVATAIDLTWFETVNDPPVVLATGLDDAVHELTLELAEEGELTVEGLVVQRDVPGMWPIYLLGGGAVAFWFAALRQAVYAVAERFGHLQRRRGVDLWPELPQLPDWRPAQRA